MACPACWLREELAAGTDSTLRFTALLHHINFDCLYAAFFNLKKAAAVGVDKVTWHEYEQNVEASIVDLHERIHRGTNSAKPSLRIRIPKPAGRLRPLGIASLEDKIVQKAVVWVLQCIYEQDFVGFSYAPKKVNSRPGRSQWTWERMQRLVRLHLPRPRITHPYPNQRFHARLKAGSV